MLPDRQREYAELLLQGKSNPEISKVMGITERTGKAHIRAIAVNLGLGDRLNRVAVAMIVHTNRENLGVRCQACGEL